LETPKVDRKKYFSQFMNSPPELHFIFRDYFNNHDNLDPNCGHKKIFAPCIIQQHESMVSPSKMLNLNSPATFLKHHPDFSQTFLVSKRLNFF